MACWIRIGQHLRDAADAVVVRQDLGEERRNGHERVRQRGGALAVDGVPAPGGLDGERREHGQLRREGLRRRDADFGAGEGGEHAVAFPRDGALGHVDDGEDGLLLAARIAERLQRVDGLPDWETQIIAPPAGSGASR